jgi:hypothetical protein
MTEKATPNIGHLTDGKHGRDAIHIAVVPMVASEDLKPGQHVGLIFPTVAGPSDDPVGIVDPFLMQKPIKKGEMFWLFLYPNTITSLRHVWIHPAFETLAAMDGMAGEGKALSERWLRDYAERVNCAEPPQVAYDILLRDLAAGDITYHGTDMHGRQDLEEPEELQRHAEIVLGMKIDFNTFTGFSCAC